MYRQYFSNFMATVIETAGGIQIGATECCLIMYGLQFFYALMPQTNTSNAYVIDLTKYVGFDLSFTHGDLIAMSTFVLSL
jgi:hypothetical protein